MKTNICVWKVILIYTFSAIVYFTKGKHSQGKTKDNKETKKASQTKAKECYRCGAQNHIANRYKFIKSTCHYCHKEGHLQKMCLKKKRDHEGSEVRQANKVGVFSEEECESEEPVFMCHVYTNAIHKSRIVPNYFIKVNVEGAEIPIDIETRSAVTLLKKQDVLKLKDTNLSNLDRPSLLLKKLHRRFNHLLRREKYES